MLQVCLSISLTEKTDLVKVKEKHRVSECISTSRDPVSVRSIGICFIKILEIQSKGKGQFVLIYPILFCQSRTTAVGTAA